MDPNTAANNSFDKIAKLVTEIQDGAGKSVTGVLVRVPDYETQDTLNYFKPKEEWTLAEYKDALEALWALCKEVEWSFENIYVDEEAYRTWLSKRRAEVAGVSAKVDFLFSALGHEVHPQSGFVSIDVSPIVVFTTFDFLKKKSTSHAIVIHLLKAKCHMLRIALTHETITLIVMLPDKKLAAFGNLEEGHRQRSENALAFEIACSVLRHDGHDTGIAHEEFNRETRNPDLSAGFGPQIVASDGSTGWIAAPKFKA